MQLNRLTTAVYAVFSITASALGGVGKCRELTRGLVPTHLPGEPHIADRSETTAAPPSDPLVPALEALAGMRDTSHEFHEKVEAILRVQLANDAITSRQLGKLKALYEANKDKSPYWTGEKKREIEERIRQRAKVLMKQMTEEINTLHYGTRLFPDGYENRNSWAAHHLTLPGAATGKFRFIVTGFRSDKAIVDPDLISENPAISASLVCSEKPKTAREVGYILDVPVEAIYASRCTDIATPNMKQLTRDEGFQILEEMNHRVGLGTPDDVLNQTHDLYHNEIVIAGTSREGHKVKVTGIFIQTDPEGKPLATPDRVAEMESLSRRKNLPIVYIRQKPRPNVVIEEPFAPGQATYIAWQNDANRARYILEVPSGRYYSTSAGENESSLNDNVSAEEIRLFLEALASESKTNDRLRAILEKNRILH